MQASLIQAPSLTVPSPPASTYPDTPLVRDIARRQLPLVVEETKRLAIETPPGQPRLRLDANPALVTLSEETQGSGREVIRRPIWKAKVSDVRPDHLMAALAEAQERSGLHQLARTKAEMVEAHNADQFKDFSNPLRRIRLKEHSYGATVGRPGTGIGPVHNDSIYDYAEYYGELRQSRRIDPFAKTIVDAMADTMQAASGNRFDTINLREAGRMVATYSHRRALGTIEPVFNGPERLPVNTVGLTGGEPSNVACESLFTHMSKESSSLFPKGSLDHMRVEDAQATLARVVWGMWDARPETYIEALARLGGDGYRSDMALAQARDIFERQPPLQSKYSSSRGNKDPLSGVDPRDPLLVDAVVDAYQLSRVENLASDFGHARATDATWKVPLSPDDILFSRMDGANAFRGAAFVPPPDLSSAEVLRGQISDFMTTVNAMGYATSVGNDLTGLASPYYETFRDLYASEMGNPDECVGSIGETTYGDVLSAANRILPRPPWRMDSPAVMPGSRIAGSFAALERRVLNEQTFRPT